MVENWGCFSVWVLRQAGDAGLLENIVLYGGFVFRIGWVRVVTITHECMMGGAGGAGGAGVCVSGMGGCGIMCISELSSFIEQDSFGIIIFQPKIFRSKLVDFKSFKFNGLDIYVSRTKPPKIFRLKIGKSMNQKCPI